MPRLRDTEFGRYGTAFTPAPTRSSSSYSGGAGDISREQLQRYVSMMEGGLLEIPRGPVWSFDQLPVAHQAMDENRANGKMVVVVR